MTLIKLSNINKTYQNGESKLHVLRDISLEISDGEFVAEMGPPGSGKSSLINIWGGSLCLLVCALVLCG